jgi:hypothetical protein
MQAFFTLAAVAPHRQRSFRSIVVGHLVLNQVKAGWIFLGKNKKT